MAAWIDKYKGERGYHLIGFDIPEVGNVEQLKTALENVSDQHEPYILFEVWLAIANFFGPDSKAAENVRKLFEPLSEDLD